MYLTYYHVDVWVFDDDSVGLEKEAFVFGTDEIIERAVADIPNARDGFLLTFSDEPFEGHQLELNWVREGGEEEQGNYYYAPKFDLEGWLCPSLFLYFEKAPLTIYAVVAAKDSGITY